MNSAAVIGRQLRQQNRAPGPLAVPGRPRAPSHVNLGPLPASVTTAGSSPHKDSSANKQEDDEKQHSLIPAYVSLGCVWKFAKALSPGVLLIAIGTAMCVVGFLAEQLSTSVTIVDGNNNITTITVNRSLEYHLHNLSFAGPAIMGLGGICIVAACVLTFGVKDHHHRVVPVDEKRPSIGEALVPILPLPPKGRRRPKPPLLSPPPGTDNPTVLIQQPTSERPSLGSGNSSSGITSVHNTTKQLIAAAGIMPTSSSDVAYNGLQPQYSQQLLQVDQGSESFVGPAPGGGSTATSMSKVSSNNNNNCSSSNYNHPTNHRSTTTSAVAASTASLEGTTTKTNNNNNSSVAGERRKSSAVVGSKTTIIVPTRSSSDSHRNSVSTDIIKRTSSSSSRGRNSNSKAKPPAVESSSQQLLQKQMAGAGAGPDCASYSPDPYPDYRSLAGSALSAAAGPDLSSVSGCSTPASQISLPQMSSGGVWTCPVGMAQYFNQQQQRYQHHQQQASSPAFNVPGPSARSCQISPAYSNSSSSSSVSVPPSSLNLIPLHTRTGATPPFKMRAAPSLSTSSTCTNFLLSPQYETTFIPSPTDLQIMDPDGCDTPSSSKSFYMSRSASTSSGLHLDMYLNRLPVSLRMQLSSKLFASMESDGLSSISTSENDIQTANDIVLRDFSSSKSSDRHHSAFLMKKRTSFNNIASTTLMNNNNNTTGSFNNNNNSCASNNRMQVSNSRTTSNEDSQEVTPLLAEEEDDDVSSRDSDKSSALANDTASGGAGLHSSFDRRFPLLRQAASVAEDSRGLNAEFLLGPPAEKIARGNDASALEADAGRDLEDTQQSLIQSSARPPAHQSALALARSFIQRSSTGDPAGG
ncbi:ankyrin repeat-containing protein kinase A [Galendromus occidentalis]|uniref:Ankyrin repeat-containing protein kinase A n=1 Tax=Galendromus occidentalis TaxID=34638 RepID=A0AAJ7L5V0_9ACAR|nr:ankyrin repeat-containing protein kinase A [Galendromus occidentalis]